jgi:hypothetical protein
MRKEAKDYNAGQFLPPITSDCVNSFVLRSEDKKIPTEAVESEEYRLQVPEIFLNRKVQGLNEQFREWTAASVCNLAEVDIWDWENYKTGTVLVLATMHGPTVSHGIDRETHSKDDQRFAVKYFCMKRKAITNPSDIIEHSQQKCLRVVSDPNLGAGVQQWQCQIRTPSSGRTAMFDIMASSEAFCQRFPFVNTRVIKQNCPTIVPRVTEIRERQSGMTKCSRRGVPSCVSPSQEVPRGAGVKNK